jgi:hypothetical protein
MAFESFEQAAEALAAANGGEGEAAAQPAPVQPAETQPSQPTETPAQGEQGGQATEVVTPKIDPSQLDPQAQEYIQAREREMQADYTRKTQEAAQARQEAEQALQFIEALNTDPNFALQVHQTLSANLQAQGLTPNQADAIAAQQIQGDELGYEEDPYMAKIQELEQWKAQQEYRIQEAEASSRIDAQLNTIRSENPSFKDEDLRDIISMGYAFGGDLLRASDAYKQITQRSIESYIGKKESVPASLNQPAATGHSETPPEGFKNLNDPRLEAAALRMLQESGSWD